MFDCTIPNNTLSRAELNYESGSVKNIHYGDILIKYGSVVDVQNDEIPFATGKSSDDFKGALLQDGDIIIADTVITPTNVVTPIIIAFDRLSSSILLSSFRYINIC